MTSAPIEMASLGADGSSAAAVVLAAKIGAILRQGGKRINQQKTRFGHELQNLERNSPMSRWMWRKPMLRYFHVPTSRTRMSSR